ncbi:MAG: metal-dependent hydrolase [Oxalobacteraceae bacterium]|nr:MAG: metal-dependent hydrolase [Oxalobacteraceae bacterium]
MTETITPRRFTAALPSDIPRHWLPGNEVVSSILNAYTILVPANEAFYVRTLKAAMPGLDDVRLRVRCATFIHQEAQHGVAHMRFWDNLDAQGYRFRPFEKKVNQLVFRTIERAGPLWLRVSLVSCVEHINAYLGYEFLTQSILAGADPRMKALMEWHFAEEIEHRRVAFDLLQAISPNYAVRVLGFALTAGLFYALMTAQAMALLAQDGLLWRRQSWRQWFAHLGPQHHLFRRTLQHLLHYLRPGFHPAQLGGDAQAAALLAGLTTAKPPIVAETGRTTRKAFDEAA